MNKIRLRPLQYDSLNGDISHYWAQRNILSACDLNIEDIYPDLIIQLVITDDRTVKYSVLHKFNFKIFTLN